ncbi:hypothetical protein [Cohnella sp. WQ 127256]|uniref:hypothetical protein n=1 Tax=Cohnella sp. WQ 127256 TaxID=2938790 RepID=UPI0021195D63|nr:hypothetical protein [Cohnella sp. WQ 127256]
MFVISVELKHLEISNNGHIEAYEIALNDEVLSPEDHVSIELTIHGEQFLCIQVNYFEALLELRSKLEPKGIQILCNGAGLNVYPSRMQLNMGYGDTAYKLNKGKQGNLAGIINIFDQDKDIEFVDVMRQEKFYEEWLKSL